MTYLKTSIMNYILFLGLICITYAGMVPRVINVIGKDNERYNLAGYTSYGVYMSKAESLISKSLKDTLDLFLPYNRTMPSVLLSQITPEKLLFLQLLHSSHERTSSLNSYMYIMAQDFSIIDPLKFKEWMEVSFNFPSNKILKIVNYIATEKIQLTESYTKQILYLCERYKVFENAILAGYNEVVKWLLENGFDEQNVKVNIFERAWINGQVDTVQQIMERGIINLNLRKEIVNKFFNNNETLLHFAVRYGFNRVVDFLVRDLGADINSKDVFGNSPLFRAVDSNNGKLVKQLISLGANICGEGLLKHAVVKGFFETVKIFVEKNALCEMNDKNGENPLFLAVERNDVDILKALALTIDGRESLNLTNHFGDTLMHIASSLGFLESVIVLKQLGAPYDLRNNYGQTPLYKAVEIENIDIVQELIDAGADVNTQTDLHDTLMHLTAAKGNVNLAKLLIKHHIKIQEKNCLGQVPLYKAAQSGKTEMMSLLISEGADISTNDNGMTMLHEAADEGNQNAVITLINIGFCNIDAVGVWGATPLYIATGQGHFKVVETLLKRGANPNARNKDLWTPMHRAAIGGFDNIVKLLITYSGNPDLKNKDGFTPLELAITHGKENVVVLLKGYKANRYWNTFL